MLVAFRLRSHEIWRKDERIALDRPQPSRSTLGAILQEILVGTGKKQFFSGSALRISRAAEGGCQLGMVTPAGKLSIQRLDSAAHSPNHRVDPRLARFGQHKCKLIVGIARNEINLTATRAKQA